MTFNIEEKINKTKTQIEKIRADFSELKSIIKAFKLLIEYKFNYPLHVSETASSIKLLEHNSNVLIDLELQIEKLPFFLHHKTKNLNKDAVYSFLNSVILSDYFIANILTSFDCLHSYDDDFILQSFNSLNFSEEQMLYSIQQLKVINFLIEKSAELNELRDEFYDEWDQFNFAFKGSDILYPEFWDFIAFFVQNEDRTISHKKLVQLFLKQHIQHRQLEIESLFVFDLYYQEGSKNNIYLQDLKFYSKDIIFERKENMKNFINYFKNYLEKTFNVKLIILSEYLFKIQGRAHEGFIFGFSDIQHLKHYNFFSYHTQGKLEGDFDYDEAIMTILEKTDIIDHIVFAETFC